MSSMEGGYGAPDRMGLRPVLASPDRIDSDRLRAIFTLKGAFGGLNLSNV